MRFHNSYFVVPIHGISFAVDISPVKVACVDDRLNLYAVGDNPPHNGNTAVPLPIISITSSQKKGDVLPKEHIISLGLPSIVLPRFHES